MRSSSGSAPTQITSDVTQTPRHHGWTAPVECPRCHWITSGFLSVAVHLRRSTVALPALSLPGSSVSRLVLASAGRKFYAKVILPLFFPGTFHQKQRGGGPRDFQCNAERMAPVGSILPTPCSSTKNLYGRNTCRRGVAKFFARISKRKRFRPGESTRSIFTSDSTSESSISQPRELHLRILSHARPGSYFIDACT